MSKLSFECGSRWHKVDFHLHTRVDDKFDYSGEENQYINTYVNTLIEADIRLGVITNHNKFSLQEFRSLSKKAKKSNIGRPLH